ncbi:hypothetical protein J5X84_23880 [Streptosporangiaceae bacterium NEAU-GS5]|nr:hypothetical protein [Streptosporangiaceae bacterium NEAU-GS5]
MTAAPDQEWTAIHEREVVDRCRRALAERGVSTSAAGIARLLDRNEVLVRMILRGERRLKPDFVRDLGQLAGVPVAELFQALGWLPEREVPGRAITDLADFMRGALRALEDARPYLVGLSRPVPAAPFAAADLLLADVEAAERFDVRIGQVVSGDRYRACTAAYAEFSPYPGVRPLEPERLARMAIAGGLTVPAGDDERGGEFGLLRAELMARIGPGLNDGQEYGWLGDPGQRTWKGMARSWPTHLLVQDVIGGRQRPAGEDPWDCADPRTLVLVGGRHGAGPAAGLLAEALAWQYVLVRANLTVSGMGHVQAVPTDATRTRGRSWLAVAGHIAARHVAGRPWKSVVLVRPQAFEAPGGGIDPAALRALRDTPARVVYARPPLGYLHWWTGRMAGNRRPGGYDPAVEVERVQRLYAEIENSLADRVAGHDLLMGIPRPESALEELTPEVPGEVFDHTVRAAWTALRWLSGHIESPLPPRPGHLRAWRADLEHDRHALLPRLTDIG